MPSRAALSIAIHQHVSGEASPEERLAVLDHTLANARQFDLVVCPELFLCGYTAGDRIPPLAQAADGPFAQQMAGIARRHGCCIVYGYPEAADGAIYNAVAAFGKDGARLASHRKMVLPNGYEKTWFQQGKGLTFLTLGGWKIAIIICYEVEFPEVVRACAVQGAELVVVPTALTAEWGVVARTVVPARAFENGVYIAYANYAGREKDLIFLGESCIVGPDGRDLARAGTGGALIDAVLDAAAVDNARSRLAYLEDSEGMSSLRATGFVTSAKGGARVVK